MLPVKEKSSVASAKELHDLTVNQKQKGMIEELKNMGLLKKPDFSLAYGPTSSMSNSR